MKFNLHSAASFFMKNDPDLAALREVGFEIGQYPGKLDDGIVKFSEMLFLTGSPEIEINTLEELLALSERFHSRLIVGDTDIWLYNDYIE